jgi:hypothetical protein
MQRCRNGVRRKTRAWSRRSASSWQRGEGGGDDGMRLAPRARVAETGNRQLQTIAIDRLLVYIGIANGWNVKYSNKTRSEDKLRHKD